MGRSVENMTAEELKTVDTAALAKEHAAKATKKREEAERKVRETARQLDYIVRAVRIEELARIKEGFELRIKEDRRRYEEEEVVEQASKAKDQWTADVADKMALGECSVFDYTSTFESMIMSARQIVHVKALNRRTNGPSSRLRRVSLIEHDRERKRKYARQRRHVSRPKGKRQNVGQKKNGNAKRRKEGQGRRSLRGRSGCEWKNRGREKQKSGWNDLSPLMVVVVKD